MECLRQDASIVTAVAGGALSVSQIERRAGALDAFIRIRCCNCNCCWLLFSLPNKSNWMMSWVCFVGKFIVAVYQQQYLKYFTRQEFHILFVFDFYI